jgi:hypothetical protein
MNLNKRIILLAVAFTMALSACKKDSNTPSTPVPPVTPPATGNTHTDDLPAIDNSIPALTINWNSTATKISHNVYFAEYGRVHRVANNTLVLTYHCGGTGDSWNNIALRRSADNGATWGNAQILMNSNTPGYYGFSDPDILVMKTDG